MGWVYRMPLPPGATDEEMKADLDRLERDCFIRRVQLYILLAVGALGFIAMVVCMIIKCFWLKEA